ncbi:MAG: hypothetical protein RSD74_12935, partial [Angelakisella sp.]
RYLGVVEAVGSSPATQTNSKAVFGHPHGCSETESLYQLHKYPYVCFKFMLFIFSKCNKKGNHFLSFNIQWLPYPAPFGVPGTLKSADVFETSSGHIPLGGFQLPKGYLCCLCNFL